ncbi:hypothetical protein [Luteimonas sp. TWI1437]|uniref:hypothetical protein n=1 Tax=unclassified Luteimonas TaxID=2629088 RepID=UPI00320B9F42
MTWTPAQRADEFLAVLRRMKVIFELNPEAAVRSQEFIKTFHSFIARDLGSFITPKARRAGVKVLEEAPVYGSYKSKNVDVAVIHPTNGPLILVGVRSQMSSVGKNVLTYYQDIVGEAISLQERFPMCTTGYAYLHPLEVRPWQKRNGEWTRAERPNHRRYARLYAAIGQRDDRIYKHMTGAYDHFAYCVADFHSDPIAVRDDIVASAVPGLDLSLQTFVPRLIGTFHSRNLWVQDIFEPTETDDFPDDEADDGGLDETLVTRV